MEASTSVAKLYIHGMGYFHPENIIDNTFLENLDIDTNNEWIVSRVGIHQRHTVLSLDYIKQTYNKDPRAAVEASLYSNAETGKKAAEMALAQAGLLPQDIGMVIVGGCSPQYSTPAEASTIAAALNIEAPAVDLASACSTMGTHMHFLEMMNPDSLPDYILCVLPENTTRTIDFSDRNTAVLWGDATHATIISTKIPSKVRIVHTTLVSDPKGWDKVMIPRLGHFSQQGSAVQAFAIKRTAQAYKNIAMRYPEKANDLYFISHQANLTMLKSVCKRCDITEDRHFYNIDKFGNTGAAGAPTVLAQNWHHFGSGDIIAIVVVGAGLTWASMVVEFI